MSITIPAEEEINGSTYYQINVKLPLRSYTIKKRYSDFDNLVKTLCHHIGINRKDFPYTLPAKRIHWLNKSNVVEERKQEFTRFLNNMLLDSSLRNEPEFLLFLQLPKNFKFQHRPQIDENGEGGDLWYDVYRSLKNQLLEELNSLKSGQGNTNTVRLKERIHKNYQPTINDLANSAAANNKENKQEMMKRKLYISQVQSLVTQIENFKKPNSWGETDSNGNSNGNGSRRIFGGASGGSAHVKETDDTIALTNQELLQHQLQIHQNQDKEIEQLRVSIAKQRQIGEAINAEVEEQNSILDQFNEEVENTSDKVQQARRRAKKIL